MDKPCSELHARRVLIVTPHYPPARLGGTELRARKLANWLHNQGATVEVITVEELLVGKFEQCVAQSEHFEGVLIHRLRLTYPRGRIPFRHSYDNPAIQAYIAGTAQRLRPDLIHLISGYLVTAAALDVGADLNIPTIITITDYWFVCPRINLIRSNGQPCSGPHSALDCARCLMGESRRYRLPEHYLPGVANRVWKFIERSAVRKLRIPRYEDIVHREQKLIASLNQAAAITLPTNSLRDRLVRAGVADRFHLSRHGIIPEALGIDPDNLTSSSPFFRFGFMGQVLLNKGVDLLAQAFQQLQRKYPAISLSIWGSLNSQPKYVEKVREILKDTPNVHLGGRYEPTQIGKLLREIDVLVVPSRWPEIGPFVILEAFATKTPVVATRIGNMMELVEHEVNGLLFELDSVEDLEHQMARFLQEPELCERLRARISPTRTHEEEMDDNWQIYSQLIQRK